nr:MAG TPA: hypothetical protein [Caudoviricetes sp.]
MCFSLLHSLQCNCSNIPCKFSSSCYFPFTSLSYTFF